MLTERLSVSSWTSMANNRHLSNLEPMSKLLPKRPMPVYSADSDAQNPMQSIRFMLPTHIDFFSREEKSQPDLDSVKKSRRENFISGRDARSDGGCNFEHDINILTKIFMDSNASTLIKLQGTPPEAVKELLLLEIEFFRALKKFTGIPPCLPAEVKEVNYKNMLDVIHRNIEYALDMKRIKSGFKSPDLKNKNASTQASEERQKANKDIQNHLALISSRISTVCEKPIKDEVKDLQPISTESNSKSNSMVYFFKNFEKFSSEYSNCKHVEGKSKIVYSEINNTFYFNEDYFENVWPFLQTAPTEKHLLVGKFLSEKNQDVICFSWEINAGKEEIKLAQKALHTIWARSELGGGSSNPFNMRVFSSENIKKSVIRLAEKDTNLYTKNYYKNINMNIYI